jgi:predicted nucleic acid-binding Zn ribbon protein
MARRKDKRKRKAGMFDVIMLLIILAVVWLFLGQAGVVPPLPIGR